MINILGVYFSGTGNTKYCVEFFVQQYGDSSKVISIENPDVIKEISANNTLVFGYPVYFSNAPKIVQDFISANKILFKNKKIFIIATMGLFSGDGTGCTARLFRKYDATVLGGLHIKMPDCIGDEKVLKKTPEANKALVLQAENKITAAVSELKAGTPLKQGLGIFCHIAGLFGQRLWFYKKTAEYKKKPDIDEDKCIGCGRCAKLCPMDNICIVESKAKSYDRCTMCYRCFSHCPTQALTILGKHVYEQCLLENYK